MLTSRRVAALASIAFAVVVYACSGSESAPADTTPDSGRPATPTTDGSTPDPTDSGGGGADSGADAGADAACDPPAPPALDGGFACGALGFGRGDVLFRRPDPDGGNDYDGGALPPGIYDAVIAERSGDGGAWRETFVVDGNGRFTRARQITVAAPGPVTHRSGTYELRGNTIRLSYDCAFNDDAGVDAGVDNLPFDVVGTACKPRYRYGATGIRITLERR